MADGDGEKQLPDKQEKFCRAIVEGKSQREAFKDAGYVCASDEVADANASRLIGTDKVQARIKQLRAGATRRTELTVAHFAKRLERLAAAAERTAFADLSDGGEILAVTAKEAADIARQHSMDAAKLLGLIIDKAEVEDKTHYAVSNRPKTDEEWATEFSPQQRPN